MPPVLLLDLDNTAYAYRPCHEAGLGEAERRAAGLATTWQLPGAFRRGYAQARDAVKRRVAGTAASHCRLLYFKTLVEEAFTRSDPQMALTLHEAYWAAYFAAMQREPDCREVLHECRERGFRLAWVTNFTTERQLLKLQVLELSDVVDFIITSEEVGYDKPRPEIVHYAISRLGADPASVWLIGDDLRDDGELARNMGLRFVWFQREEQSSPSNVECRVRHWAELRAILFS